MNESNPDGEFFANLSAEINKLVLNSSTLTFSEFEEACRVTEAMFSQQILGRCDLELELQRRLQERRLGYWLDRPGNAHAVNEQLLARCALGFEAPWHEGQVFLRAIRYLLTCSTTEDGKKLLKFLVVRATCEQKKNPSPVLEQILDVCGQIRFPD